MKYAINMEKETAAANMTRKAAEWADVAGSEFSFEELRKALPVFTEEQAFSRTGRRPIDTLKAGVPQWFILAIENDQYLVDTQGYDYCRYALRLKPQDELNDANIVEITDALSIAAQCLEELRDGRQMAYKGDLQEIRNQVEKARRILWKLNEVPCMACGAPEPCGCGGGR